MSKHKKAPFRRGFFYYLASTAVCVFIYSQAKSTMSAEPKNNGVR